MSADSIALIQMFGSGAVYGALAMVGPFLFGLAVKVVFGFLRSL